MANFLFLLVVVTGVAMIVVIYRSGRSTLPPVVKKEDLDLPLGEPSDISDPDRALLWSTQIGALRFVRSREPRGCFYTPLKLIYIELAREFPEIHDGSTFQEWVEFYVRLGLFRFEGEAIHIARRGRELLEYLEYATTLDAVRGSN